jgi:hypothetical protein
MEPEISLPYSKVPATCSCPEPTPSIPPNPFPLPEDPSYSMFLTKCPLSVSCRVMLPLEQPPPFPGDPSGGVVYLRIVLSPEEATFLVNITLQIKFSRGGVVSTSPNPQAGGPHLVVCPRLLIQFIRNYPPYRGPFVHPQPEDCKSLYLIYMVNCVEKTHYVHGKKKKCRYLLDLFGTDRVRRTL